MAEQIHYRPADAKHVGSDSEREFERLQGRVAEINGLLDELYASGIVRWLKDLTGAMPQVSAILLDGMNTREGQASLRNLAILAQQLGRIDPDELERLFAAANAGVERASRGAADDRYQPPGITGVLRLLHDKELWDALAPAIAGLKAFSAARSRDTVGPGGADDNSDA